MSESTKTPAHPCSTLGLSPSFGFGDRIGLATPGHVEAMKQTASRGSSRSFPSSRSARWPGPADALPGHGRRARRDDKGRLDRPDRRRCRPPEDPEDVDVTAAVGFTFFTIDPSGNVDAHADDYDEPTLRAKFAGVAGEVDWIDAYRDKSVALRPARASTRPRKPASGPR